MREHNWTIEHATRGRFARWGLDSSCKWRPFFHYSSLRADANVKRFHDEASAKRELAKLAEKVRGCYLCEMGKPGGRPLPRGSRLRTVNPKVSIGWDVP
jgi:hypothetical protein